jgi:hypothetical protein
MVERWWLKKAERQVNDVFSAASQSLWGTLHLWP